MADVRGRLHRDRLAPWIGFGVELPPFLDPGRSRGNDDRDAPQTAGIAGSSMPWKPGIPRSVRLACEKTVLAAADGLGVIRVESSSYGTQAAGPRDTVRSPIFARIVYWRSGGYEFRQAPVVCVTDAAGKVVDLEEMR